MGSGNSHLLLAVCNHLALLSELLDGVDVSLLSDLSLNLLNVVQVEGGGGGSETWGRFIGDGR